MIGNEGCTNMCKNSPPSPDPQPSREHETQPNTRVHGPVRLRRDKGTVWWETEEERTNSELFLGTFSLIHGLP